MSIDTQALAYEMRTLLSNLPRSAWLYDADGQQIWPDVTDAGPVASVIEASALTSILGHYLALCSPENVLLLLDELERLRALSREPVVTPAVVVQPPHSSHPPFRVWLQWYGDGDPDDFDQPPRLADVTWCVDNVFDHDVEYIRVPKQHDSEMGIASDLRRTAQNLSLVAYSYRNRNGYHHDVLYAFSTELMLLAARLTKAGHDALGDPE